MPEGGARPGDFSDVDSSDANALIAYLAAAGRLSVDNKRATYGLQNIGSAMSVLDAGCGTGDDVREISAIVGPTGRVVGVDSSAAMIAYANAQSGGPNASFSCASVEALPFADGSFDVVRAERVLQHIASPDRAVAELHRVARTNGSVLTLDQDWETLMISGAEVTLTRRIVRSFVDHLASGWAGRDARGLFRRAGFASITSIPFVAVQTLPIAFDSFLSAAIDYALEDGVIDAAAGSDWLSSLLRADAAGEYFSGVSVVVTLGTR